MVSDIPALGSPEGIDAATTDTAETSICFHYIKSNLFRVIHADGAIGSVTPSGMIHIALYNERPAIPTRMTFARSLGGGVGDLIETEARPGYVREIEVDAFISSDTARSLVEWLQERIKDADRRNKIRTISSDEGDKE